MLAAWQKGGCMRRRVRPCSQCGQGEGGSERCNEVTSGESSGEYSTSRLHVTGAKSRSCAAWARIVACISSSGRFWALRGSLERIGQNVGRGQSLMMPRSCERYDGAEAITLVGVGSHGSASSSGCNCSEIGRAHV